jgi:hypothetical protein
MKGVYAQGRSDLIQLLTRRVPELDIGSLACERLASLPLAQTANLKSFLPNPQSC